MDLTEKNKIIESLIKSNCIKTGKYTLKCGDISKYYFDMKNLISYPQLLKTIGDAVYKIISKTEFDIICGIPYGGLPIASYISVTYNKPMIFVRDTVKMYGTQKFIEGEHKPTDRCIIIDDVITSGSSIQQCLNIIKDKVNVVNIMTIFNRQQQLKLTTPFQYLLCKNDVVRYRLQKICKQKASKLCFSADINDPNRIIRILDQIGRYIVICKIHYDIIDDSNNVFKNELINMSIKHNFLIMEDRKFNDISYIVEKQYSKFNNWVDMVTVHSLVASEVISKLSGALIVSSMSNNNYDFTERSKSLARVNSDNVIGFITQHRINVDEYPEFISMTPGVSNDVSTVGDQKYRNINDIDADIYIVGRALYNSNNIKKDILKYTQLQFDYNNIITHR